MFHLSIDDASVSTFRKLFALFPHPKSPHAHTRSSHIFLSPLMTSMYSLCHVASSSLALSWFYLRWDLPPVVKSYQDLLHWRFVTYVEFIALDSDIDSWNTLLNTKWQVRFAAELFILKAEVCSYMVPELCFEYVTVSFVVGHSGENVRCDLFNAAKASSTNVMYTEQGSIVH